MARGVYVLPFTNITVVGATTLAAIRTGTTCALQIMRMWCGLKSGAAGTIERVSIYQQVTTFPTVVSTTPTKTSDLDAASQITGGTALAAGTCGTNASAEGGGAITEKWSDQFHTFNGWLWLAQNADEPLLLQPGSASCFGFRFLVQPTTLAGWSGGIEFKELG